MPVKVAPFGELLSQALRNDPARTAIIDGDRQLTYGTLSQRVEEILGHFHERGFGPGTAIGLAMNAGMDFLVFYFASHIAGMRVADLPPFIPFPVINSRIESGQLDVVILDRGAMGENAAQLGHGTNCQILAIDDFAGPSAAATPVLGLRIHTPAPSVRYASISYTSGTTGPEKAVAMTAEAVSSQILLHLASVNYPINPVSVWSYTNHQVMQFMASAIFVRGGTVVTLAVPDVQQTLEAARRHKANVLFFTTRTLFDLADRTDTGWMNGQVQLMFHGGERLTPKSASELIEKFGQIFVAMYGMTETCPAVMLGPRDHDPARPDVLATTGYPMPGAEVRIVGSDNQPVPDGELGEVALRSPAQMLGYIAKLDSGEPDDSDGWFFSGDVGRRNANGTISILDRISFSFEVGGERIYPGVLEMVLCDHPSVAMAIIVPVPDDAGSLEICSAVVTRAGQAVNEEELRGLIAAEFNGLSLHRVRFLDALPVNIKSNKPDRNEIKALFATSSVSA